MGFLLNLIGVFFREDGLKQSEGEWKGKGTRESVCRMLS